MHTFVHCPTCAAKLVVVAHTPGVAVVCPVCQKSFVPAALASPPRAEVLTLDDGDEQAPRSRAPLLVAAGVALFLAGGWLVYLVTREKPRDDAPWSAPVVAEAPKEKPPAPVEKPPAAVVTIPVVLVPPPEPKVEPPAPPPVVQDVPPPRPPINLVIPEAPRAAEQVNKQLLQSTVWIVTNQGIGSGSLVHQRRGLVVTNYHVVGEDKEAVVFFPAFDVPGELITNPNHYVRNRNVLMIRGTVVGRESSKDLAIIRLDRVPENAPAVPLAAKPAAAGANVYSIGASGLRDGFRGELGGALWRFSTGTVRGRYEDTFQYRAGQRVTAMVLETQKPVNRGDSGGPTVNDRGELVGVVSSGDRIADAVKFDIDVVEVRTLLTDYAKKNGWAWDERQTAHAPRLAAPAPATVTQLIARANTEKGGAQISAIGDLGAIGPDAVAAVPFLLALAESAAEELQTAIGEALTKIGPPDVGAEETLIQAVVSKSLVARTYAARSFATNSKVPSAAIRHLVQALSDTSTAVRVAAAEALGGVGARAKVEALPALLDASGDKDLATAIAAAAAIEKLGPFDAADRPVIAAKLKHKVAGVRKAAARTLAPLVATAEEAAFVWTPVLLDASAEVRAEALASLGKYPAAVTKSGAKVVQLIDDPDPTVRRTAVTLAVQLKSSDGLVARLGRVFAEDAKPEVRTAAAASVAVLAEPTVNNLPLLRQLLASSSPAAKRDAAVKLAVLQSSAAPAVGELLACVPDADEEVCAAAIRALTAVGKEGGRARDAVAKAFAKPKAGDAVLVAAANYLAATDGGEKALKDARNRPVPPDAVVAMCRGFARTESADMLRWMTAQAAEVEGCRQIVTGALAKHGKDEQVRDLIELTYSLKAGKPGQPDQKATIESRRWALATLTKMNTTVCTPATREKLADRVKSLSTAVGENEKELAAEAAQFYKLLKR